MSEQHSYQGGKNANHGRGVKGDWDFRISDLVKTLMELIFNTCGEFR